MLEDREFLRQGFIGRTDEGEKTWYVLRYAEVLHRLTQNFVSDYEARLLEDARKGRNTKLAVERLDYFKEVYQKRRVRDHQGQIESLNYFENLQTHGTGWVLKRMLVAGAGWFFILAKAFKKILG